MRNLTLSLITTSILALSACGGEPDESTTLATGTTGGTTGGTETTASTNPTSVSATEPNDTTSGGTTTGNSSNPTTGPTTGEPGTTTGSSTTIEPGTAGSSDATTGEGTTGEGTTGEGTTGGGTTGAVDCAGFGPMECMAQDACQAITGSKLNTQKMCVAKPTFFECTDAVACDAVQTYACDAMVDPPEPFLFPSSCLPMGWEPCEAPPLTMPCK